MIEEFKFGFFKIKGKEYYDDIKLMNDKVKLCERPKSEIKHKEIKDLIKFKPDLLIIGTGIKGNLVLSEELKQGIERKNIKLVLTNTPKACENYNKAILKNQKVAAFLHATG